jgi:TrmH family RNA methyltransferase
MVNIITSLENNTIKHVKKIIDNRNYRHLQKTSIIFGEKTILSAFKYNVITDIFLTEKLYESYIVSLKHSQIKWHIIENINIFKKINPLNLDHTVFALIKIEHNTNLTEFYNQNCIILDNIQDPGNLGTIFRTAQAAGIAHFILSKGCVDIYSPKVLRATMGIQFALKIIQDINLIDFITNYKQHNGTVLACSIHANKVIYNFNFHQYKKISFIFGNEGHGISKNILESASDSLYIPMYENTESINVATAVAVTLYELYRQLNFTHSS